MTRVNALEQLLKRVGERRRGPATQVGILAALKAPPLPRESTPELTGDIMVGEVSAEQPPLSREGTGESVAPSVAERSGPSVFVSAAPTEPSFGAVIDRALRLRIKEG
jgi:hypothetical protein